MPQKQNFSNNNPLAELEASLRNLSHENQAVKIIQDFAQNLGKTFKRQEFFNKKGVLIREPIFYQDVFQRGLIEPAEDSFVLLQGDIVATDAAYFLGERITGSKFIITSSTCDLIPGRRPYSTLLRISPIYKNNENAKTILSELLAFKSTRRMYLPPLPNDGSDVVGNAVEFDGVIQIRLEDLLISTRYASLSLVGWRIFGSMVRSIMVRTGDSEVKMRSSLQEEDIKE